MFLDSQCAAEGRDRRGFLEKGGSLCANASVKDPRSPDSLKLLFIGCKTELSRPSDAFDNYIEI